MPEPTLPTNALIAGNVGLGVVCLVLIYLFVWAVKKMQDRDDQKTQVMKDAAARGELLVEKVVTVQARSEANTARSDATIAANSVAMQGLATELRELRFVVQSKFGSGRSGGYGSVKPGGE